MPPPRLSRYLRPCHLPVTAKQVRCVHTTGRAKLSTTSHDTTSQTPSAKDSNGEGSASSDPTGSKNHVTAEEKSWWKKALGHIAPIGTHGESIESTSGQTPPHVEQPERPAIARQQTGEGSGREERGSTQLAATLTTSQQDKQTQPVQMGFADWRKDDLASSGQADMTAIQQQIHQLSAQIRALEARLETGSPTGPSSSTSSAGGLRTLAIRPKATQFNMDSRDLAPLRPTPADLLSDKPSSDNFLRIWREGKWLYARAVRRYGRTAKQFVKLPPHIVAPRAPSILRHFISIRAIAMMDDDSVISETYFEFKQTVRLLEKILRKFSIPAPRLSDPLVAAEVMKYSKTLWYDTLISHTLHGCRKRYRLSSSKLVEIVAELGNLKSPMVAPMAIRARAKLRRLLAHGHDEEDWFLTDSIGSHYKAQPAPQRRISARTNPSMDTSENEMQNGTAETEDGGRTLIRQIPTQPRSMKSSTNLGTNRRDQGLDTPAPEQHVNVKNSISSNGISNAEASTAAHTAKSSKRPLSTDEVSEQSLLEELFPETNSIPQPQPTKQNRDQYPRLELPKSPVRPIFLDRPRTPTQKSTEFVQQHGEKIAVLQLTNCSTGLTEADFRRIIPKGKHLEGWRRDSDFYKVIPGRDPLSLERLPFYYLLFKNTEAALSYQKNASRLHKLSARYQPSSILSAIPPPKGFLEDGEDIAAAVASYNLLPKNHTLSLNVLMQPYNPALRQLIERGGYRPIAPAVNDKGRIICRVLLHIEGYEPSPSDLFSAITRDAYKQGMLHPLCNESQSSIHRLRDMINLKMSSKAVSSSRPRAYGTFDHANLTASSELTYDDPEIQSMMVGAGEDRSQAQMNQEVMNRVYNRWVLDFEDVDTARRWSLRWHRRPLPDVAHGESTWKDAEEARICNTEVLW